MNFKYVVNLASVVALVAVLFFAWFFRWNVVPAPDTDGRPIVYMLDRITGEVFVLHGVTKVKVER